MKKTISIFLVFVLIFVSIIPTIVFAQNTPSDWAVHEVNNAKNAGILTDAITKDYQKDITREEFCELVVKLYEKLTNQSATIGKDIFTDTDNQEILKAYSLGIVQGVSSDQFAPYNNITRQEICVMLVRCIDVALESADINDFYYNNFADKNKISDWAIDYVNYAYDNGIMKGVGNNCIDPLGNTTCEQSILLAYRIYSAYAQSDVAYEVEIENINDALLSCIGKTKKDIVNLYGDIIYSSYWLGGKYYVHQNMNSELFYMPTGSYNDSIYDDVNDFMKCNHMIADLSELLQTPDKGIYTIEELRSIFGDYEFSDTSGSDGYPFCADEYHYKDYKFIVEFDSLDPVVSEIYVFKSDAAQEAFTRFLEEDFQHVPLNIQAEPYLSLLEDDFYLSSMQQIISYSYLDVDHDGQDELIISSKILSPEYDMGGSCFSLWDYSSELGVYNVFAKAGMLARSAYTYSFEEKNGQIFLSEGCGSWNSSGRDSYRNLYQIKDGAVIPVLKVVYNTYDDIYTINDEHVFPQNAWDKIIEIGESNRIIEQGFDNWQ